MHYRLPSLNALRAFEAAARHLSFTRAADELCVTQGAISRHIGILEASLDKRLFIRNGRGLALTSEAEQFLESIQEAFDIIDSATRNLSMTDRDVPLRILSLPTFATRWLMPRIHKFTSKNPDILVSVSTGDPSAPSAVDADVVISTKLDSSPDVLSEMVMSVKLFPVCRPQEVAGKPPPRRVSDLAGYPLLCTLTDPHIWDHWAQEMGWEEIRSADKYFFQNSSLVFQAAADGVGVGMGIAQFVDQEIRDGSLVAPFAGEVQYTAAYYMNIRAAKLRQKRVNLFRQWIAGEASRTIAQPALDAH